jgi:hypothetical protein
MGARIQKALKTAGIGRNKPYDLKLNKKALPEIIRKTGKYIVAFGEEALDFAVEEAPFDTGNLRNSLVLVVDDGIGGAKVQVDGKSGSGDSKYSKKSKSFDHTGATAADARLKRGLGFGIFTQTGYGAYHELGTSKIEANPFIRPGVQKAKAEWEKSGPFV